MCRWTIAQTAWGVVCALALLPDVAGIAKPEPQRCLGWLPAGVSPDSIDFTETELYVLDRGTVSVFSLSDLARVRTFGGSGRGPGRLSPNHTFDQAIRVAGGRTVLAEDNDKLITFSLAGEVIEEKVKPENSVWFVPLGNRYVGKSMVVSGTPPLQIIRVALYDDRLREVKELYRQPWFQQPKGRGFSTVLLGDQLHFAVARDRVCVEESPKGFVVECFDASGNRVSVIERARGGVPVTAADRDRELALVRGEKRVAAMIAMTGSWDKLQEIWTITFPAVTPPLRELQAEADRLLARTFERRGDTVKYVRLDLEGGSERELWLPMPTDAETEARVSGTAFFKFIGSRYYYLRYEPESKRWGVFVTTLPV